jgi:hypothetical protein
MEKGRPPARLRHSFSARCGPVVRGTDRPSRPPVSTVTLGRQFAAPAPITHRASDAASVEYAASAIPTPTEAASSRSARSGIRPRPLAIHVHWLTSQSACDKALSIDQVRRCTSESALAGRLGCYGSAAFLTLPGDSSGSVSADTWGAYLVRLPGAPTPTQRIAL